MDRTQELAASIAAQCSEMVQVADLAGFTLLSTILGMAVLEAKKHMSPPVVIPISDGRISE